MLFRSDRKSTRLNSSHTIISYAVFCLKKKNDRHRSCPGAAREFRRCTSDARSRPSDAFLFFFNDAGPPEIYPLPLHDPLPISPGSAARGGRASRPPPRPTSARTSAPRDRKSTRLNSSHTIISNAGFCLKKKDKSITLKLTVFISQEPCNSGPGGRR